MAGRLIDNFSMRRPRALAGHGACGWMFKLFKTAKSSRFPKDWAKHNLTSIWNLDACFALPTSRGPWWVLEAEVTSTIPAMACTNACWGERSSSLGRHSSIWRCKIQGTWRHGAMERRSDCQHRIQYLYLWYCLNIEIDRWDVRWVRGSGGWVVMATTLRNFGSWTGFRYFDTDLTLNFWWLLTNCLTRLRPSLMHMMATRKREGVETDCKDSNLTSHQIPIFVQENHGRWTSSIGFFHVVIDQGLFKGSCCDLRMGLQVSKQNPDWTDAATGAGWRESILKLFFDGVTWSKSFARAFEDISISIWYMYCIYLYIYIRRSSLCSQFWFWFFPSLEMAFWKGINCLKGAFQLVSIPNSEAPSHKTTLVTLVLTHDPSLQRCPRIRSSAWPPGVSLWPSRGIWSSTGSSKEGVTAWILGQGGAAGEFSRTFEISLLFLQRYTSGSDGSFMTFMNSLQYLLFPAFILGWINSCFLIRKKIQHTGLLNHTTPICSDPREAIRGCSEGRRLRATLELWKKTKRSASFGCPGVCTASTGGILPSAFLL